MPRSDLVVGGNNYFLKINLGSVMLPMETATSSQPLMPNSFNLVCMVMVSGNTSTIRYSNRFCSCALGATGFKSHKMQVDTSTLIPIEIIMTRPWFIPPPIDVMPHAIEPHGAGPTRSALPNPPRKRRPPSVAHTHVTFERY